MTKINVKKICKQISNPSFNSSGILSLCDHDKNEKNPDNGAELPFVSSGETTNRFKDGLAGLFSIEANIKLISLLDECHNKYPKVYEQLVDICSNNI